MRKRTLRALQWTRFRIETHPALVALIEYAGQRPDLDVCNYDCIANYNAAANRITRQWRTIVHLLDAADHYAITDAQIIQASRLAYRGRMEWRNNYWRYCSGGYWPVEYRSAVIAILRAVIPNE